MPLPAGTGLDRRSFLARGAGLALAVYGGTSLVPRRSRRGSRAAAAAGRSACSSSVFLDGGADSLSMLFPAADPLYRKLRPRLALAESDGAPFAEDRRLRWHPSLAPLAALHGEGKVTVLPGVGYDRARPVALHVAPLLGGGRDERAAAHRLARPLPRPGRLAGQPAAGPLARVAPPAGAGDGADAGRLDRRPDRFDFWTRGVWGEVETRMLDAIGALGALPTTAILRSPRRPRPRASRRDCDSSCSRSGRRRISPASRARSPIPAARTTTSRAAWPASRRCSARACRCASSR